MPTPLPPDLAPIGEGLGRLIQRLQAQGLSEAQLPVRAPMRLDDCGWVANRWCELLGLPPQLQQRLMVLDNPLVRLELIGDILQRQGIET